MVSPRFNAPWSMLERAFRALSGGGQPLVLDATEVGVGAGGAPPRLEELRTLLRDPATDTQIKNRVWAVLIEHVQTRGPAWALAAVGMALPSLARLSGELAGPHTEVRGDLDSEILAGFLTALASADTPARRRFPWLMRVARNAGLAWLAQLRDTATPAGELNHHGLPLAVTRPGHPDVVLAEAVAAGILTSAEAELIAATRLERRRLTDLGGELGVSAKTLWMRRARAEARLVPVLCAANSPHRGPAAPIRGSVRRERSPASPTA